jgi:hypothetical protein
MTVPAPRVHPPALTDVWPHLPHPARRRILAQLDGEARAVRAEAAARRVTRAYMIVPVIVDTDDRDDLAAITARRRALLAATEKAGNGQRRDYRKTGKRPSTERAAS